MRRWLVVAGLVAVVIVVVASATSRRVRSTEPGRSAKLEQRGSSVTRAPRQSTLRGRVSSRSAGIPAAIVTIEAADVHGVDQRPRLAITDPDGSWRIAVAPDTYIVTASADGFLPLVCDDVEVEDGDGKLVDLELTAGGTRVHGVVKDIGGGPIAGAHVGASAIDGYFGHGQVSTISRADGTYALTLPSGAFELESSHDDYASASEDVDVAGDPVALDFSLIPAGTIRGEVIASDTGKPVPGAIVYAGTRRDEASRSVAADEQGVFVIDRLDGGVVDVFARGGGYSAQVPLQVELPTGQHVDGVRIVADRAYTIRGRVVDQQRPERGVASSKIMLDAGEHLFAATPTAKTRDDGRFELENISRGDYRVVAYGDLDTALQVVSVRDRDVDVTVQAVTHPSIAVAGHVVPPVRAKVSLGDETALADDHGEFKLEHARPGKQTLFATTTDGRGGQVDVVVGERDLAGVEVRLAPLASIAGKVVDTRGTAMEGFHVEAMSEAQSMASGRLRATSRADGSFRLIGVEPGEVHLFAYVEREAYRARRPRSTKVEVAAGAQVTGVTLVVEPRDGVIHGRVISLDGTPVADAWVTAEQQHAFTAADGTFTLEHLRPHDNITAEDSSGARRGVVKDVEPGATVTITLAPLATLTVHVTAAGGPASAYYLRCLGPGMFDRYVSSPTGDATYDHCRPATYSCTASTDEGVAVGTVTVGDGPARLDLVLAPWPTLSGTVVDAAGTPQPGIFVSIYPGPKRFALTDHVTDARGRFEIDRVPPGRGAVVLSRDARHDDFGGYKDFTVTGAQLDLGEIELLAPPR